MVYSRTSSQSIELSTKLMNLPDLPGVYLFRSSSGTVTYVGKAKSLRHRVKSYFTKTHESPRTERMVSAITDFETYVTDSELEALILESNLIKEYQPKYNVNLKDDKRYPYIKITNEQYPRLLVVRQIADDKSRYFGPYTNVKAMRWTLRLIRRIFPVRSCSLPLPSTRKYRVCLDYFLGRCPGCCEAGKTTPEEYAEIIEQVIMFLSGRSDEVMERLTRRMYELADKEEFEKAAIVRDQIEAIKSVIQKQKVVSEDLVDRDIVAMARAISDICVVTLQVRRGVLIGRQHFYLTAPEDTPTDEILKSFVVRYYKTAAVLPSEIYLPHEVGEHDLVGEWFVSQKGRSVKFVQPRKGQKFKLLELAEKNARLLLDELLAEKSATKRKPPAVLLALQRDLYLKKIPRTIAACDISNLGPEDAVGSVVFFTEGKPLKKGYRRFKIRSVEGQDDFSMMAEVVGRYFNHLAENGLDYPDLLLIDGGKGQLNAALGALWELGIVSQQAAALAKRLDEVYLTGRPEPIGIPRTSSTLRLLQRVRDEAHRFAVAYHRNLRARKVEASELDGISGIGEKRKYVLLAEFGSVESIAKARLQDLLSTPSIPRTLAVRIYEYFHPSHTSERKDA